MLRGMYTAASGMTLQMHKMDVVSNNMANVDLNGYKKDEAISKSFPEMLIRRFNDDGVVRFPFGSIDMAPVVGKMGSGTELNEIYTKFEKGYLKTTNNNFDFAIDGKGFFSVNTDRGERYTRNGAFTKDVNGILVTQEGLPVLGKNGVIKLNDNMMKSDEFGNIYQLTDPRDFDSWELVDQLKVVNFDNERYLKKQGQSLWLETEISGPAYDADLGSSTKILNGIIEGSNVNPVEEMVKMIQVNRAYEANQKALKTHDDMTGKLLQDGMRI
ncbi:MAG: flagellar hook-basal body protein [Spirochaetales bacterium]|nr:flagellar hook-basal body protein [Spirochaetales bacterium]